VIVADAGGGPGATRAKLSQRARLVDAMVELSAQVGYQAVSIAQVSSQAGVSSATFYEQFKDKEDCLLAAYEATAARVFGRLRPLADDEDWPSAARRVLDRLLSALQSDPNGGRVLLVEALAGGQRVRAERERVLERFELRAQEFLDGAPRGAKTLDIPAEALIGAVRSIVSQYLRTHNEDRLPLLVEDLLAWLESYAVPAGAPRWSTSADALLPAGAGPSATPDAAAAQAERLPRGRHRLPAGVVARSQRTRIINGTAEVVMAKGYAEATVKDIVAAAGISRDVFYEHFANKLSAFLAAQQYATQNLLDACGQAYFAGETWPERVWNALGVLIAVIASNPALSHLRIVECYPAGSAAIEATATLARIATIFLQEGYQYRPEAASLPRMSSHAITGAVFEVFYGHFARGESEKLPRRLPQLTYIAIAPFTGPEEATRVLERLSRRRDPLAWSA
jgi:AcrR family transcriptional regulator